MARRNGNSVGYLGIGVMTIAAGAALGYYVIGGVHPERATTPASGVQEVAAPTAPAPKTPRPPRAPAHPAISSNYTAPGAPHIQIVEDSSPTLDSGLSHHDVTHSSPNTSSSMTIPTPDSEASQQAAGSSDSFTTASGTGGTGTSSTADNSPSGNTAASSGTGGSPLTTSTASGNNAASVFSGTTPSTPSSGDSEASQAGISPSASSPDTRPLYRIQTGSFTSPQDAQTYANTLSGKGITASVSSQNQAGQMVYKVQVGAYHDRATADQAATGFRRQGVPVTISTVAP